MVALDKEMRASQIRIKGVVRTMNHVREKLTNGVTADELEKLKVYVAENIKTIENMCKQHSLLPIDLPAPSHKAYKYLKDLDLSKITPLEPSQKSRGKRIFCLPGLVSVCRSMSDEIYYLDQEFFSRDREEFNRETEQIFDTIQRITLEVEQSSQGINAEFSDLPIQTLRAYQWLKYLSDLENFQHLLDSIHYLRELVRDPAIQGKLLEIYSVSRLTIGFANMSSIYSRRVSKGEIRIKIGLTFIYAGKELLVDVLNAALFKDRVAKQHVKAHTLTEEFSYIQSRINFIGQQTADSKGQYHDLSASFGRTNQKYFNNKLQKPSLAWNQIITGRQMGLWVPTTKSLIVSIALDTPNLPEFVIDFVMYHELLHMDIGTKVINGRFFVHTPEFKRRERQHEYHTQARKMISALVSPKSQSPRTLKSSKPPSRFKPLRQKRRRGGRKKKRSKRRH